MKSSALLLVAMEVYRAALPGYRYEFPRDHYNHPEFQTEWWYYTGNLHDASGRRFGFELTFFRHGVDRASNPPAVWDVRDAWLAHLALSDLDGGRFFHAERLNRAGAGLAGADQAQQRVWNGNWESRAGHLQGIDPRFRLSLELQPLKAPLIHGENGISQKSPGAGRASHYISLTRIATKGTLTIEGREFQVEGLAWMDHEFFTHQLDPSQAGWDWFSLQFDDGTELMLFRLRRQDGTADPYSAGTYIDKAGRQTHLKRSDFEVTPGKTWQKYPIEWRVKVPAQNIDVQLTTRLPQQEMPTYWEGAIEVKGTRSGAGYLEMTGYKEPVKMGE